MFLSVSQITSRISGKDRSNPRLCHSNPLFSRSNPHVSWKQINKQQEKTSSVFSRIKRHLVAKWFSLKISQWILWIFIIVPINISRSGEFSHHFQANTHHNILLIITPIYNISYVYIYIYIMQCVYIYVSYIPCPMYIYICTYIYIYIYHLSQLLTPGVSIFRHRPRRDYAAHRNFSHRSEGTRRRSRCRISMEKVGSKPIFTLIFWGKTLVNIGNISIYIYISKEPLNMIDFL